MSQRYLLYVESVSLLAMLAAAVKQEVASSRSRAVGVSGGKKIRPSKSSRQQSASATDQRVPVQIEETMEARQVYMPPAVITYDTTHNDEDLVSMCLCVILCPINITSL